LVSLGPTLHAAGRDLGLPLPFAALHEIPIANHIRIPMRYGLMAFLGSALLAGAGTQWLAARLPVLPVVGVITALVLAEAAVLPYPTLPWSVPPVYNRIAGEPGNFSVLEIPSFSWRSAAANEVYQVVHGKRLLRAYTNRIAPDIADYFSLRQTPIVVRSLRLLEGAQDGTLRANEVAEDRKIEFQVNSFFNLRYVIVHRDQLDSDAFARIDFYLTKSLGYQPVEDDPQVRAYYIAPDLMGNTRIDLTTNGGLMYLGRGWQTEPRADVDGETGRYLKGSLSEIYFLTACSSPTEPVIARCGAMTIRLRVYSEKAGAVLQWQLNGRSRDTIQLQQGWADYSVFGPSLPNDFVPSGMNTLRLISNDQQNRVALQSVEIR
ncbi:MAG: hypothetical protein ACM3JD_16025, partial [Rudaea sp.]